MQRTLHDIASHFLLRLSIVCLGLILALPSARTQTPAASVVAGQITDEQGRAVPAADVKLIDSSTKATRQIVSNGAGRYTFTDTTPGVYTLIVSKAGFAQSRLEGQRVEIGLAMTLDIQLQVGSIQTTIEVKAGSGAGLQT